MKRFLLATTALVAATNYAHAGPLVGFVGLPLVNALLGTSLTLETVILGSGPLALSVGGAINIGASVGLAAASFLLGGAPQARGLDPGTSKNTFESQEVGRIRALGRLPVGGLKIYGNSAGYDTYRLIAHCADPIDGIEDYLLGGRSVTIEANGDVSSPPYAKPGGSYVNIQMKTTAGATTVWSALASTFPDQWDSSKPGNGFVQSLVKYTSPGAGNPKLLKLRPSGWPEFVPVARYGSVYDPRTGTSGWTENAILICLKIALTNPQWALADFDLDIIADEADRADALVSKRGGGTEKRARLAASWQETDQPIKDVLAKAMLSAGIEMIVTPAGKYAFKLIDDNRAAEIVIAEKHILSDNFEGGPEGVERYNKCRVRYLSPERSYTLSEIPLVDNPAAVTPAPLAWSIYPDEIAKYGERVLDIELPFCPSASQAQRIARRIFANSRADRVSKTMNMVGHLLWYAQTYGLSSDAIGGVQTVEITGAEVQPGSGRVTVNGFVQPALSTWTPATDEALPPVALPSIGYDPEIATPSTATASVVVTYPDTTKHTRFSYPDVGAGMTVEAQYRIVAGPGAWTSMSEWRATNGTSYGYTTTDLTGVAVEFRHMAFNAAEDGSNFSTVFSTTPAANNAAPATPALSGTNDDPTFSVANLNLTAPSSLNVAYLTLSWSGTGVTSPGSETIATNSSATFARTVSLSGPGSSDKPVSISLTAHASDGTSSAAATYGFTIPGAPP